MQFAFWNALTNSYAIGDKSDWPTVYIKVLDQNQQLIAVMPIFVKHHHQGEYVFDYAWADAYQRYSKDYYPRLVTSVPFTPVTGERVWLTQGTTLSSELWHTLLQAINQLALSCKASTWHGLFISSTTATMLEQQQKLLHRMGCQFMWHNYSLNNAKFVDFDDFLATLTAKKRKSIRVERKKVAEQGIICQIKLGAQITDADWEIFYQCYAMTYLVRGRQPYLSLEFFEQIGRAMSENLMLAQAIDEYGEIVANSLFFYDATTLYGRYWGCLAEYDSLHFELCYYQGIEFAIRQGLAYFDPGTQGEHKLIRGFIPILTHSVHQVYEPLFRPALARFCQDEQIAVLEYQADAMTALPFNQDFKDKFISTFTNKT